MSPRFRPHGQYNIRVEGQLLLTEVLGPWNRELVEDWAKQVFVLIKHFSAQMPYVGITTIQGSMLCPQDAMLALQRAIQLSMEKLHCLGNVIVAAHDVDGHKLMQASYLRIGLRGFFDDFAAAKTWADAQLAVLPPP